MAQSEPRESTDECPTCEEEIPERFMSGTECVSCEHERSDARDAQRSVELNGITK